MNHEQVELIMGKAFKHTEEVHMFTSIRISVKLLEQLKEQIECPLLALGILQKATATLALELYESLEDCEE